jgi:hypothetical protein
VGVDNHVIAIFCILDHSGVTAQKNPLFRFVCSFIFFCHHDFMHHHASITLHVFAKPNFFGINSLLNLCKMFWDKNPFSSK